MDLYMNDSWKIRLKEEFTKDYFASLKQFVDSEYKSGVCFPPEKKIFSAFDHCPFEEVKVVIIGQDPYHGLNQANGLCFSVNEGIRIPPSLVNIFKEIETDLGIPRPVSGDLGRWSKQGVLLLNATLTVRANEAGSHQNKGWERFTDAVISRLNEERDNLVFMLWGNYAQKKGVVINPNKHLVLKSVHPSPLSAYNGFFGSKHFSKANSFLKEKGIATINW
jgi:uracil-DNA glycosylase